MTRATLHNPDRDAIRRFDSPEEYHSWLSTIPSHIAHRYADSWSGGSFESNMDKLAHGDMSVVDEANAIIDQLKDAQVFTVGIPVMRSSVVGFIPNVPAAIIGHPKDMWRRDIEDNTNLNAPLTIYTEVVVSGGVEHEELMRRGVAVLAFVLAMQAIRPVELYTINMLGGGRACYGTVTKIETKPLDLARAAYMLTSTGYARALAFSSAYAMSNQVHGDCSGQWPWGSNPQNREYEPAMREMLGMQPEDIFLCGAFLYDKLALTDPVAWVKQMIEKHNVTQGE
jgi:hypothetical protein